MTPSAYACRGFLAQVYKGRLAASYTAFPEGSLAPCPHIIGRYEGETACHRALQAGSREQRHRREPGADQAESRARRTTTDGMRARMLASRYTRAFTAAMQKPSAASQAHSRYRIMKR